MSSTILIYIAGLPLLAAMLWAFWPRSRAQMYHSQLAEYIYWFNSRSNLVRAQFGPKPHNDHKR